MKLLLVSCGICEHWYKPDAHYNHCPACGAARIGKNYYNVVTGRQMIKSGWPIILKRLINVASQGV